MLTFSRATDEPPPFVVPITVVKLRLSNRLRKCSSDSVSESLLTGTYRAYIGNESIDLRNHVPYWQVMADAKQSLKELVVPHGLQHVCNSNMGFFELIRRFFAATCVPA